MKTCGLCGVEFEPAKACQKYHSKECATEANRRNVAARDANRDRKYEVPKECRLRGREGSHKPGHMMPAQRRVPVLRARTLAETPDVPAEATRGDQLTGKAGACCTAGRVIHAHGGME